MCLCFGEVAKWKNCLLMHFEVKGKLVSKAVARWTEGQKYSVRSLHVEHISLLIHAGVSVNKCTVRTEQ